MSVGNQVKQTAIKSLITVFDHGMLFSRVVSEIQRVNKTIPGATGEAKKARVLADLKIIFDDVVEPVGKSVLNLLIELGVAYVTLENPVAGEIAGVVGAAIESELK